MILLVKPRLTAARLKAIKQQQAALQEPADKIWFRKTSLKDLTMQDVNTAAEAEHKSAFLCTLLRQDDTKTSKQTWTTFEAMQDCIHVVYSHPSIHPPVLLSRVAGKLESITTNVVV